MAKKRTKEDKKTAVYQFVGLEKKQKKLAKETSFFGYDIALIYADLRRTAVVTVVVVAVLLGIMVYT